MWASGCENRYVKALGPPIEILDAIKCISLFKVISMFYAEGYNTKHWCLVSLD